MTNASSNVDTCLVCSRTVPGVVSDNCDTCRKVFTSQVSAGKQQSCNKSHTLMTTTVTSRAQQNVTKRYKTTTFVTLRKREHMIDTLGTIPYFYI